MADSRTQTLAALALLMVVSMIIGGIAHRTTQKGGFLSGYFLGNRGLGSWSMAFTATVMSGGTFLGFPSLVYKFGWVVILWIASYMVVPLCTFGVLGKRMGQLARRTGAITLPELLRERFGSPALGMVASAVMIFVLAVSLVAQFKGGHWCWSRCCPRWDRRSSSGNRGSSCSGWPCSRPWWSAIPCGAGSWQRSGRTCSRAS
jgi:Na+/pantothenate symporter